MKMKKILRIEQLIQAAKDFCVIESNFYNKELFGITDGKAVGTYIEQKFLSFLDSSFDFARSSSAKGIDLPSETINTDIKVTSIKQPQSSCPFKDASQKIFGLGHNLLIFVYNKTDDEKQKAAILDFVSCSFLEKSKTADYTTTYRIREMLVDGANKEDIISYLLDKNLPVDEIGLNQIADRILSQTPEQGYLTISNALQCRLQYSRIVYMNENVKGIIKIIDKVSI